MTWHEQPSIDGKLLSKRNESSPQGLSLFIFVGNRLFPQAPPESPVGFPSRRTSTFFQRFGPMNSHRGTVVAENSTGWRLFVVGFFIQKKLCFKWDGTRLSQWKKKKGWWFQFSLYFHPSIGEDSHLILTNTVGGRNPAPLGMHKTRSLS